MRHPLTLSAVLMLLAPAASAAPVPAGALPGLADPLFAPAAICARRTCSARPRPGWPGRPASGKVYVPGGPSACARRRMVYCGEGPLDRPFEKPPNMMPPRPGMMR